MKTTQVRTSDVSLIQFSNSLAIVMFLSGVFVGCLMCGCAEQVTFVEPEMLALQGNLGAHDPVIIREADTYYIFTTGGRPGRGFTPIKCSSDMINWGDCGSVFERLPEWRRKRYPAPTASGLRISRILTAVPSLLFHLNFRQEQFGHRSCDE
jgi:hypothetical protein